jgi:hypothetical protein
VDEAKHEAALGVHRSGQDAGPRGKRLGRVWSAVRSGYSAREWTWGSGNLVLILGYLCDIGLSCMYLCPDVFHGLVVSRVVSLSSCTKCHVALIM